MTATDSIRSSTKDADPSDKLHELVLKSLDDDQAVETVTIPLAGKSSIADHM
ncbi:MAG: ribosome silencing factor, partial [Sphingomonadales bacterium]